MEWNGDQRRIGSPKSAQPGHNLFSPAQLIKTHWAGLGQDDFVNATPFLQGAKSTDSIISKAGSCSPCLLNN